jgi:AraC-like DNA-binding protein
MAANVAAPGGSWGVVPIARIEDLHDGVYGAGLEVLQMSRAPIAGSLAFAFDDDVVYSSGYIDGHVGLTGPLSETMVTLGLGLRLAPGTRHWLNEIGDHAVGVFMPGDEHEAYYTRGSLYAGATLSVDHLEAIAGGMGLVLDRRQLGGSGFSGRRMEWHRAEALRQGFEQVHRGDGAGVDARLGREMLHSMIHHLAREPTLAIGPTTTRQHGVIVRRACAFIAEHLEEPLSLDAIARAAFTSHRTLQRAFADVLDETPQSYARKLRLNRIRHDLATEREARCTITLVANRWGISELGRLSGWYRDLFGELPSQTTVRAVETGERVNQLAQVA